MAGQKTETVGKLPQSHTESSQPGDKKPDNNSNQPNNGNTEDTKVDTGIPFIKDEDGKNGWNVIRTEEEKAEEGSIINVDMNGSTVVPGIFLTVSRAKTSRLPLIWETASFGV